MVVPDSIPDQELLLEQIKAWGWTVREVKDGGGELEWRGSSAQVPRDVDISVVFVPPLPGRDAPAMAEAVSVFDALHVNRTPLDGAAQVAERAQHLIGAH